jgi:P pilus assembly chaperone PapD
MSPRCLLSFLFPAILAAQIVNAPSISPHRIIFGPRERSAELLIINEGKMQTTYRISFVEMEMDLDGHLKEHPKREGEIGASDLVRFSPRQVTLDPGAIQVIRIQVRKPAELPEGEYRSHLIIKPLPLVQKPEAPDSAQDPQALTISIQTIMNVAVPVFVRQGATHAEAGLAELRIEAPGKIEDPPILAMKLLRTGNQSLSGKIAVFFRPKEGEEIPAGETKTYGIYRELDSRPIRIPLERLKGLPLSGGRIRVSFTLPDGKAPSAEAALEAP